MAGVGTVQCLVPGSKKSGRCTDWPAASASNRRGKLNSHCGDASVLKIHTPLSNFLVCLLGSNTRLSEDAFGYEKTASAVSMFGSFD